MPTLLEMQKAMQASLLNRDNQAVSAMLAGHVSADRLDIYRNTFVHTLTKTLRLCFPVTERLVGEDFFEGAAQIFIEERPPRVAWLDLYGGEFPEFLSSFPPATSIAYLGDVAELEWAVNSALHAADIESLDVAALSEVECLSEPAWCFLSRLCAGSSIEAALVDSSEFDCSAALAEHLALGRFVGFGLVPPSTAIEG